MSKFYDSDMYGVTQTVVLTVDAAANNDADDIATKLKLFTAGKVTGANIVSTTIGASDTSGVTIKLGTSSIGACVAGTTAVLTAVDGTVTETTYAAGGELNLHTVAATETGVFQVAVSYQERYA
jgi:hypothetical protein